MAWVGCGGCGSFGEPFLSTGEEIELGLADGEGFLVLKVRMTGREACLTGDETALTGALLIGKGVDVAYRSGPAGSCQVELIPRADLSVFGLRQGSLRGDGIEVGGDAGG